MALKPRAIKGKRTLKGPYIPKEKPPEKFDLPLPPTTSPRFFTSEQVAQIQERIGIIFRNLRLLEQSFAHRSFPNEINKKDVEDNQRLEFLGDSIIGMIVAVYLFKRFPDVDEGQLTRIRSVIVSNRMFARIVEELRVDEFILMSKGERKDFDARKSHLPILADFFEAFVGALFLDRGLGAVEIFLDTYLFSKMGDIILENQLIGPKSKFQELCQEKFKVTPHYEVLFEQGPMHQKEWTCGAFIGDRCAGRGIWSNKAGAENLAAREALEKEFGIVLPDDPLTA